MHRFCANGISFYIRDLSLWILVSETGPGTSLPMETRYQGMTVVVPIAVICYSKRIQRKISKGERCMGQSLEETRRELPEFFSSGVTQDTLINPPATSCDSTCEMLSTRGAHWRPRAQGFYWGWSHRHPVPGKHQIPDSQKESRCSV